MCTHSAKEDSFASVKHFWEHHNWTWNIHLRSVFWLKGRTRTRPVVPYRAQARMYLPSRPPLACTHGALAPTVLEKSYLLYIQRCNRTNASLYVTVKRSSRTAAAQWGTAARTQCHFTDFVDLLSHFVHRQPSLLFDDCREGCSHWLWIMFTLCSQCVTVLVHVHEQLYTSSNHAGVRGSRPSCFRIVQSARTSQTNWTLGIKRAWSQYWLLTVCTHTRLSVSGLSLFDHRAWFP